MKTQISIWPFKARLSRERWGWISILMFMLMILVAACSSQPSKTAVFSWPSSTPEEQGMDSQQLLTMLDRIDTSKDNLHSLLVLRNGNLVFEAYYPPFGPQDRHLLFSATKSITSALVGIAVNEGKIKGIDQPVLDYFPEVSYANPSESKKNIHIHDLLNMTSGLVPDDNQLGESQDGVKFALSQPMSIEPGAIFEYNSGNTHLLSAIIQKTTGKMTSDYAREKLFGPLGIQDVYWEADPSGVTWGNVGLMLTPREMAAFGDLYLHNGQWKGQQVVPASWVEASFTPNPNGYAYQWWLGANGYAAMGYAGQIIYIIPSKDLVVVSTAALPDNAMTAAVDLADVFVAGAVKSDKPLPESPAAKELADRLAAIANPKAQAVPALPAMASAVNGKTLQLDENPLGWKTAKLVFDNQQAWLTITTTTNPQEQKFAVGLDGLYRKTDVKKVETLSVAKPKQRFVVNPFEFNFVIGVPVDGQVAMKGEWPGENEFLLTVQDIRDFDLDKLSFQFNPAGAKIEWKALLDGTYDLNLTGKFE